MGLNLLPRVMSAFIRNIGDIGKGIKPFNKSGLRVLSKEIDVKLTDKQSIFHGVKLPTGATTASYAEGERLWGKEGFSIVSFYDSNGTILETHRQRIVDGIAEKVKSTWYYIRKLRQTRIDGELKTIQKLVRQTTHDYDNLTSTNINMFIDNENPVSPRTLRSVTSYVPGGGSWYTEPTCDETYPPINALADRFNFSIEEIVNGVKRKLFRSKVDYSTNSGRFYTSQTPIDAQGLNTEEISQLSADRYLPLKLHSGINRYEFLKKDVLRNMGMEPDFKIIYKKNRNFSGIDGGYQEFSGNVTFNLPDIGKESVHFDRALSTMAHEFRHKYQFDLYRAYARGELTNPEEIALAKKFGDAMADKEWQKFMRTYDYNKDGLEIDAFAWEGEYRRRFYRDEAPLRKIFGEGI